MNKRDMLNELRITSEKLRIEKYRVDGVVRVLEKELKKEEVLND